MISLLCGGAWWYNANQATARYREQKATYVGQVKAELKGINEQFRELSQQGDSKKSLEVLAKLQTALDTRMTDSPTTPQLFGVTLTAPEDSQKRGVYIERLSQLKRSVTAARDFMAYQQAAAAILQEATTKTGPNAEQQKALADAWGSMSAKLNALAPTREASSVHQHMVSAVTATHTSLAALPDLFTKKDIPGFTAKRQEAEAHINTLRALGDTIRALAVAHDKNLARDYAALNETLK